MKTSTQKDYAERILKVLLHIQGRLDQELGLEELARVAHFSPYHFHRVFRGMVGEGVKEHVRRLRLERAAHQLRHSERSVTDIAFDAGYETHESFTRAFRARFELPPSRFREQRPAEPAGVGGGDEAPAQPGRVLYAPDGRIHAFTPHRTDSMQAEIKTFPARRVAFVRHTGPYDQVGAAWGQLCAWAGPRGLLGPQTAMYGLCHDDPEVTPADKIRYDACVELSREVEAEGAVAVQEIPAGDYAVTTLRGPYSGLAELYARLCGEWVPAQGREIRSAPSVERYLNDPNSTPPEQLLTEVAVPLEG